MVTKRRKPAPKPQLPIDWVRAQLDDELALRRELMRTWQTAQDAVGKLGRRKG